MLSIATIAGLIVAVLALMRDTTDLTIGLVNSDSDITINYQPGRTLDRCQTVSGTATFPPDSVLWVAHRDLETEDYYFRPADQTGADQWSAQLELGSDTDSGSLFNIHVFFLPVDVSDFVGQLGARSASTGVGAYWFATALPPGVAPVPLLVAARNEQPNAGCT